MIEAAKNLDFEKAAQLRDLMSAMIQTDDRPTWVSPTTRLRDTIITMKEGKK
jgi:excinuclease UvrABC nuclease subunit